MKKIKGITGIIPGIPGNTRLTPERKFIMCVYFFTIYLRFNDSKKKMALHHAEIAYTKAKAQMCAQLYAQQLEREFNATIINIRYDGMGTN